MISNLSAVTIVNVTDNNARVWIAFVFIILNSLIAYFAVYRYWGSSIRLKHKNKNQLDFRQDHTQIKHLTEKDQALHTVLVRHFPPDIDAKEA